MSDAIKGIIPSIDGQRSVYRHPQAKNIGKSAIFVNGVGNTGENHRESANELSFILNCEVVGIFNQSSSIPGDVFQCFTDLYGNFPLLRNAPRFPGLASLLGTRVTAGVGVTKQCSNVLAWLLNSIKRKTGRDMQGASAQDVIGAYLQVLNPAAKALFDEAVAHPTRPIYAHSQGTIIACNALIGYWLLKGNNAPPREVHFFGSPDPSFPPGVNARRNEFSVDPVTFLKYISPRGWYKALTFESNSVWGIGHAFLMYLEHDAEFLCNFRKTTIVAGVRTPLDTKALAGDLVRIGTNFRRLAKVFEYLDEEEDAETYREVVRSYWESASPELLANMVASAPALRNSLEATYHGRQRPGEILKPFEKADLESKGLADRLAQMKTDFKEVLEVLLLAGYGMEASDKFFSSGGRTLPVLAKGKHGFVIENVCNYFLHHFMGNQADSDEIVSERLENFKQQLKATTAGAMLFRFLRKHGTHRLWKPIAFQG